MSYENVPKNLTEKAVLIRGGRPDYSKVAAAGFPVPAADEAGAVLENTDTGDRFRWSGAVWYQTEAAGDRLVADLDTLAQGVLNTAQLVLNTAQLLDNQTTNDAKLDVIADKVINNIAGTAVVIEPLGVIPVEVVKPIYQTAAFGELAVSESTPLIQIKAQYGILEDVLSAALGGTTTAVDSKFVISTGVGAGNVAAVVSATEAHYKSGQGLACRITALFTQGKANSTQQAGFITSESGFGFGYNGTEFGIVHARDGSLSNQNLIITSGASSSSGLTVTVDNNAYIVPVTSGTIQKTAYEIATSLNGQVAGYSFTSNSGTVFALAQLPDLGGGTFAFSPDGTGVSAAWVEIKSGVLPTETWIKKSDWNVNSNINIDPTKGNVYQIQLQYLGFGGIKFFIENPDTANYELVHIIKYANTSTIPSVDNPIFRVGWAARNKGNTSDIVVQGASAAAFNEGIIVYDGAPKTICANTTSVGTTATNILSLRNRLTFNSKTNRAEIIPLLVVLATDSTKTAIFEVTRSPIVATGDYLDWVFFSESGSLMEQATNKVSIIGGSPISCFLVKSGSSLIIDINKILQTHPPNTQFAITARVSSGSASDMDVSVTWKEDL